MAAPIRLARRGTAVLALAAATVATAGTPAQAAPDPAALGRKLAQEVTVDAVNRHLIAFQRLAEQNGGSRYASSPGYDASATYVHDKLVAAGLDVHYQEFEFPYFEERGPAELDRLTPSPRTFAPGEEVVTYTFSGNGAVTAAVQPVDVTIPATPEPSSTSGCEAADFADFTPGNIALIQRGFCFFEVKIANAIAAGAVAVIFFNEGQVGRTAPFAGTLNRPFDIPAVGISFADGQEFYELSQAGAVTATVRTDTLIETRTTRNVIAETRSGRADNVVMAGAHLDSVNEGPGINDNGTGSAALIEVARAVADEPVRNKVRFAWWSAEEFGLLGSNYYTANLTQEEQFDIALYLNFDMIGSPNYARFLYDGDDSDGAGADAGPFGSAQIEQLFADYFADRGLPVQGTDFTGRSDYFGFIGLGIPAGGIFTGAEGIKTAEQAELFGGTAGVAFDPCYHQACDNLGNVDRVALRQNSKAIGFAVGRYARDTSDINGVGSAATAASKRTRSAAADRAANRVVLSPADAA